MAAVVLEESAYTLVHVSGLLCGGLFKAAGAAAAETTAVAHSKRLLRMVVELCSNAGMLQSVASVCCRLHLLRVEKLLGVLPLHVASDILLVPKVTWCLGLCCIACIHSHSTRTCVAHSVQELLGVLCLLLHNPVTAQHVLVLA